MINLIVGPKGTGKTKKLTEMANAAARECFGAVLCVEKGDISTFRVPHSVRLIDTNDYEIKNFDELYGLISGAVASNYDIQSIFLDSSFRIGGKDPVQLFYFLKKLEKKILSDKVTLTITVSCKESELPEGFFDIGKNISL